MKSNEIMRNALWSIADGVENPEGAAEETLKRIYGGTYKVTVQAEKELSEEKFREEVEQEKERIRKKRRPFLERLFNKRLIIKLEDKT